MSESLEQQARDLLERAGVEDAQYFSTGELTELANILNHLEKMRLQLGKLKTENVRLAKTLRILRMTLANRSCKHSFDIACIEMALQTARDSFEQLT